MGVVFLGVGEGLFLSIAGGRTAVRSGDDKKMGRILPAVQRSAAFDTVDDFYPFWQQVVGSSLTQDSFLIRCIVSKFINYVTSLRVHR